MKLEINHEKKKKVETDHMETKQHATKKNNGLMMNSKRKSENTLKQMTMKIQPYKIYGIQQKQF